MSNYKFTGFPWHIEKFKGTSKKRRTCFNCINFSTEDHSCNKKLIPITNNNAMHCTSYINAYKESTNTTKYDSVEIDSLIKDCSSAFEKMINNSVRYGDIVKIKNLKTNKEFELSMLNNCVGEERQFIKICLRKKINDVFKFKKNTFQIISLEKNILTSPNSAKKEKSNIEISKPPFIPQNTTNKPIAEKGDILYVITKSSCKNAQYNNSKFPLNSTENKQNKLIKKFLGKPVGYSCKYQNNFYKLVYIEKN
mgnify:CR=1 FL=1